MVLHLSHSLFAKSRHDLVLVLLELFGFAEKGEVLETVDMAGINISTQGEFAGKVRHETLPELVVDADESGHFHARF